MLTREEIMLLLDYGIYDDETGDRIGVREDAPEEAKAAYEKELAESKEIEEFTDFALKNIIFNEKFEPIGVAENAPPDTMERYKAFVDKYYGFPVPCID